VEANVQEPSIERIRNATFPLSVRGYDRSEVDTYLAELADWLETGGGGGAAAVEAVRTELERIGEQTGQILTEAHQAGEGIRADASAGVRQQLVDANRTAETVRAEAAEYAADTRDEADAYARKVRGEADAYASRTTAEIEGELAEDREAAKKDAARTIAEANKRKSDVESVITDLEKRRDAVLAELDRLASGIAGTATEHRGTDNGRAGSDVALTDGSESDGDEGSDPSVADERSDPSVADSSDDTDADTEDHETTVLADDSDETAVITTEKD
jgi:DivIVA domain-containing protein